jgi:hypothetical protein
MFFIRSGRVIAFLIVTLLLLNTGNMVQANKSDEFARINKELKMMHDNQLFKGGKTKRNTSLNNIIGKGEPVVFDSRAARKEGFSEQSIVIAEQMAALSNDLLKPISAQQQSIALQSNVDARYPALAAYFAVAKEAARNSSLQPQIINEAVCGWYANPRPSEAAPWRTWDSDNPDQTLRSWGYHSTPEYAFGGGYTRAQTWSWWACGFNTFRDHAYVTGARTIREQNYEGWSPRGEPNPEVYASGPWPYPDWPAYVLWWHLTH